MRDALDVGSVAAAGGLLAVAIASFAACPSAAGPSDDALASYLERHGITSGQASDGDDASPDDGGDAPAAKPIARRLALTVERGTGLPDLDVGPGTTDPYLVLEYEGQRYRTSVIEGDLEPVWGDTFIFDVRPGGVLVAKLMDEDSLASDEQLGTLSETLPDLRIGETRRLTLAFRNGDGGKVSLTLTGVVRP
jgi:hypothetical protein